MPDEKKAIEFAVLNDKVFIKRNGVMVMIDLSEAEPGPDAPNGCSASGVKVIIQNMKK